MPYHDRKWKIADIEDPLEMAQQIVMYDHCVCTGFRCQGILWLNDNFPGPRAPDAVNEWAVVRESDGKQCESITVGWQDDSVDRDMIVEYHTKFVKGSKAQFGEGQMLSAGYADHPEDYCYFCA